MEAEEANPDSLLNFYREAIRLRNFIRESDPGAFLIITSSTEIIGNGFRGLT